MTNPHTIGTATTLEEAQAYQDILHQCFNVPVGSSPTSVAQVGLENLQLVRSVDRVVGGLKLYPMGQWFGGQRVPMAGVAAVAIAPEHRGTGAAVALLRHTLQTLHQQGVALSTLYAATQRLYRKVGYEQAGIYCHFSIPAIGLHPITHDLPMHRINPTDWQEFRSLYQQQASYNNGNLDRHPALWESVVRSSATEPVYSYLVGSTSNPQGYIIFTQSATPGGYDLRIRDWVALTPEATERLWTFLADHRSLVNNILWYGSTLNPWLVLLPEQTYQVQHQKRWFLRIVDVISALTVRGYPKSLDTQLHLDIQDALIPANHDRFVLSVSQGQGHVERGGTGTLQLDIRGLAPLYTALLTAYQLQAIGYLSGSPDALATATLLFAGSEPWMPDHF